MIVCLAVPGRVVALTSPEYPWRSGVVDFSGNRVPVSLALVPEAQIGDYVLIHAGVAIQVLDETAVLAALATWEAGASGKKGDDV